MATENDLAPPMIPPDLMPLLSGDPGSGDASMEARPMTGSASGPNPKMDVPPPPSTEGMGMTPRTSPMGAPTAELSPQGPPPSGKQQFHDTMADFGHLAEKNRAAVIGLNPSDPDYLKKLEALQAQHGTIVQEKARYQMLHPWGGPESAHPGVLGKIGHALGEVGQIAGSAIAPGVEAEIPGTQAHLHGQIASGEGEENKAIEGSAKTEGGEAKEETASQYDVVPYGGPDKDGVQHYVPKKDLAKLQQQELKNTGAVATQETKNTGAETVQGKKNEGALDVVGARGDTAEKLQQERLKSQEMIAKGHDLVRGEVARLQQEGANSRAKDPNALTNTMKTMKQQAQSTLPGIDRALDETEKIAKELGPGEGRWNNFWQGTVGVANPAFSHYKDEIAFVSSAVTLAHARGRMSNELFQHFQQMFDAGKQAPENMIQALNVAKEWLTEYANMGEPSNATTKGGGGESQIPRAGEVVDGHRFKGGDPSKKESWEKVGP